MSIEREYFLRGEKVSLQARAKINLRLKVLGRREDGYHLLSMLNATVSLADNISLRLLPKGEKIRINVSGAVGMPELNDPAHNLVSRAAKKFFERWDLPHGLEILINKKIPVGGGLGGGSSNAACVLRFLHDTFLPAVQSASPNSAQASEATLQAMALEFGADIPYLLHGGLAAVTGIGEKVKLLPNEWHTGKQCLVVLFPFSCETKSVYQLFDIGKNLSTVEQDRELDLFLREVGVHGCELSADDLRSKITDLLHNDLEHTVRTHWPVIGEVIDLAQRYTGVQSSLSGSGSTVFLVCDGLGDLRKGFYEEFSERVSPLGCRVIPANFC